MSELAKTLLNEFKDKEYAHAYIQDFTNMVIAAQIKTLREDRQWSQDALAKHSGMKQARISNLENIEYSAWTVSTLSRLAKAFDTALKIEFVPFSERILDIVNTKRGKLSVLPREEDLRDFCEKQMRITHKGDWTSVNEAKLAIVIPMDNVTSSIAINNKISKSPSKFGSFTAHNSQTSNSYIEQKYY